MSFISAVIGLKIFDAGYLNIVASYSSTSVPSDCPVYELFLFKETSISLVFTIIMILLFVIQFKRCFKLCLLNFVF